ncbi:hypothetical protein HDV00_008091 [Rhizophlyctis rosea]|nr:hypothetical protein HDV00_008091 [Rhizophlyctis rosea]
MGTRSWTRFFRRSKSTGSTTPPTRTLIGIVYRQFDDYPEGVGMGICNWLLSLQPDPATPLTAETLQYLYLLHLKANDDRHHVEKFGPGTEISSEGVPVADGAIHSVCLFIEWIYDVEIVEVEGKEPEVRVGIIPGGAALFPGPAWVAHEGTVEDVKRFIKRIRALGGSGRRVCFDSRLRAIVDETGNAVDLFAEGAKQ